MDKLRIITLNARGLKNKLKRTAIFNYLKTQQVDIACLQECHASKKDIVVWERQWGGKMFFQEGTGSSRGEIIMISKHFSGTVNLEICQDRLVVVTIQSGSYNFTLANVYAPNKKPDKVRFFNILKKILSNYKTNIILMGDFNCVRNNELDIISGHPHNEMEIEQLRETTSALGVHDLWRIYHAKEKDYTWSRQTPFIARRLDYCFATEDILTNLVACEHLNVPNTDHKAVLIELNETNFVRGPGYWHFNNSYLKDAEFVEQMNRFLEDIVGPEQLGIVTSSVEKWELCKIEIREFCISYGKQKACKKKNKVLQINSEIKDIEKKLIIDPSNEDLQRKIFTLKQKLELMHLEKARGAQTRARVKWIEEGEKNTKFFCSLEKSKRNKNTITRLKKPSGETITDQGSILQEQVQFYKKLYSQETESNNIPQDVEIFLNNIDCPRLNNMDANSCEGLITITEASEALYKMKNGASPGRDGITTEFMKFFWSRLREIIVNSFTESFQKGELSHTQKQGVISLLHKGNELSREHLNNWRPITLTNTDYKILAKSLAFRLSGVIHKLVHIDQVGYLKGRNIATVIRTIDDTINYLNKTGKAGYLLALDYSKAFDSISKTFLNHAFELFGFGPEFRKWTEVLTTGSFSCINHGGWLSESFQVSCGIRQGCPFSPLAFILAVEVLAIKIRNSEIRGITLPKPAPNNSSLKIKQFADDTTLFLKDRQDIELALRIINFFAQFSGLKLNNQKTKALAIRQPDNENLPFTITDKLKILGIYFQQGTMAKFVEENWTSRVEKLNNLIKAWSARDISIHGKVVVIKTFLVSQFDFVMQSVGLPEKVLQNVNRILYKFLWQRRFSNKKAFEKIKRKILQMDYDKGGVKMIDMNEIQKCYSLQWAGKLANCENENWSYIPQWHMEKIASKFGAFDFNCRSDKAKQVETIQNEFWKNILITFLNCKSLITSNDINTQNFSNQLLFNNQLIMYKRNVLYFANWKRCGLEKVKDIINTNENRLLSLEEIQNVVEQNNAVTLLQYNAIVNALPRCWKEWISDGNYDNESTEYSEVIIYNTKLKIIKQSLADKAGQSTTITPHACNIWQQKLGVHIDENVWQMPRKATKEIRLKELQWKIVHRIYPTNIILQKMKVSETNKCNYCVDIIDHLEHFFCECTFVTGLWQHIESMIAVALGRRVKLTTKNILFGVQGDTVMSETSQNYVNHVILIGKVLQRKRI